MVAPRELFQTRLPVGSLSTTLLITCLVEKTFVFYEIGVKYRKYPHDAGWLRSTSLE